MGSVIVVPSVRFESSNPNLSGNHGDHLNTQLHHPVGHHRYFVPLDIYRYDRNGRLIRINRPTEDVSTICLEFTNDFVKLLQVRLIPHAEMVQSGAPTTAEELEAIIHEVHIIPAFVKELLARKRDEITQAIAEIPPVRPAVQAISELAQIADYCSDLLARN